MTEQPAATRAASTPSARRIARVVLVVGIVAATGAGFGPLWAARVGVGVAVVAGILACGYAWREATAERRAGTAALLAAGRDHGAALTAERTHNSEVVDVLSDRVETAHRELADRRLELGERRSQLAELSGTVSTLRGTVSTLRDTVSTLRDDAAALRIELSRRDATVDVLRDALATREAELRVLSADEGDDAEVHAWPRHLRTDPDTLHDGPTGELPAVVDLRLLDPDQTGAPGFVAAERVAQQA